MVKLRIENNIEKGECWFDENTIKPYDKNKWADGLELHFNSLQEAGLYMKACDIDFTDEIKSTFNVCSWGEIETRYIIDWSEKNTIIFSIDADAKWID